MLAPSCAIAQPTVAMRRLVPVAMKTKPIVMMIVPSTIQIRRRPHRLVVRSETRPKMTLASVAKRAPTPPRIAWAEFRPAPVFSTAPMCWRSRIFSPIPTIAGPSRATKKMNWATISQKTKLFFAGSVGS